MSTPIPKPPGVPLLGNIRDIDPSNTWWSLKTLAEKYGEIFQIKVLGKTIVFVAGAALAEEICDQKRFRKYVGGPIEEIRYSVNDALFTAYDEEASWGIAHRIIAPTLSPQATATHFGEIRDCALELIQKWSQLGNKNVIQPLEDLNRLNLEATALTMFGKKLDCINAAKSHPMLQAMEDSTSEAMKRPTRPKPVTWLLYPNKLKNATKVMRDFAGEMVRHRKQNPTDRQDFLAAILNARDPETGIALTESQVIDQIVSMPIGSSTGPCALTALIYFLLQNPEVVNRARNELDTVIGEGAIVYEHLAQLPYIQGVVRETLRLSFAAPGFNIEPIPKPGDKSPVLLGGGKYQVAHNQTMIIVLAGVNRDPTVFDEPLAFRPERMIGESFDRLPAGVKKWFGNGKRACIGKHWAWDFLNIVTALLIKEIDFETVDPDYVYKQDGWFNVRPIGFEVRVKKRTAAPVLPN
ncbi:Cytochrome P450 [Naviculisporaceae sp. PSN 640]